MSGAKDPLNNLINVDNQKLLWHKQELSDYLNGRPNKLVTIEVDLTTACNHRCPECPFGGHDAKNSLEDPVLEKILKGLPATGAKGMIITGGGEPCLHKRLGDFVRRVNALGVDVTLTTNGQLLHKHFEDLMRSLKRIRFSMDAFTPETYQKIHGVPEKAFEEVLANIRNTVSYKRKMKSALDIGVSFLICKENLHEVPGAVDFYKELGVNFLHFKPMQLWDKTKKRFYHADHPELKKLFPQWKDRQDEDFRVSFSRENYFEGRPRQDRYAHCHGSHFDMIIGADAKVYTCCHFKYNPRYAYGDLRREGLLEIMTKVKDVVTSDCFADCKMDAINQFVEFAKDHTRDVLKKSKAADKKDLPLGNKWL